MMYIQIGILSFLCTLALTSPITSTLANSEDPDEMPHPIPLKTVHAQSIFHMQVQFVMYDTYSYRLLFRNVFKSYKYVTNKFGIYIMNCCQFKKFVANS